MDDDLYLPDGIEEPNFTQFPNLFLDQVMARVSHAEWKVLSFLCRQTWGFHRYNEPTPISVSDVARGTGMSKSTATAILALFEDRGFLQVERTISPAHGKEANSYQLRVRKGWSAEKSDALPLSGIGLPASGVGTPSGGRGFPTGETAPPASGIQPPPLSGDPSSHRNKDEKKQRKESSKSSKDIPPSDQSAHVTSSAGTTRIYNEAILNLIDDLSRQFNDADALSSNRTRIMRIWSEGELDEATFMDLMYEARRRTLKANVTKRSTASGQSHAPGRMPYWFAVLQNLIDRELGELPET